ncbi:hypothetical protein TorRG33x02_002420 [Trema orientale]|uniref:Uncharacterized protein n=1 Tax=Trema orientale TaxID=63057 RepID=A0A2P5G1K5_TREOI|nr:hypothetical protein TorRG33x02_002420 [Trema orientale]
MTRNGRIQVGSLRLGVDLVEGYRDITLHLLLLLCLPRLLFPLLPLPINLETFGTFLHKKTLMRLNLAGLGSKTVPYLAEAIQTVVTRGGT